MRWLRIDIVLQWLMACLMASLVVGRVATTVLLLALIAVGAFRLIRSTNRSLRLDKRSYVGYALLIGLFLLELISWGRYIDHPGAAFELQKKLGLIGVPLAWWLSGLRWQDVAGKVSLSFSIALIMAGMVMLVESGYRYLETGDVNAFFYHNLAHPVPISSVYFSWYLFIAIILMHEVRMKFSLTYRRVISVMLWVLLLLAASKLFVVLALVYAALSYSGGRMDRRHFWKPALFIGLLAALIYPVVQRFSEMSDLHLELVTAKEYRYDAPFNGLNLRLVQWRFGAEILSEESAWIMGVGTANKQDHLNAKYEATGMYTGNPAFGDQGYKVYNFHNQYVETTVSYGLGGIILLIALLVYVITGRNKNGRLLTLLSLLCFVFMITESLFERMQGIFAFALLFSFLLSSIIYPSNVNDRHAVD